MCCADLRLPLLDAEGQLQVLYFSSMLLQSSQTPKLPLPSWAGSRASRIPVLVVLVVLSSVHRRSVPLHLESSGVLLCLVTWDRCQQQHSVLPICSPQPCCSPACSSVPAVLPVLTTMAKPAAQLGRAGARCCHNVTGNGVFPPAVSWGICCAIQSQVWLLLSSPSARSWYVLFCGFPAVLLQVLGPEPSSRDTRSVAAPPRDRLAAEPARGFSYSAWLTARASGGGWECGVPSPGGGLWGLRCDCPPAVPHRGLGHHARGQGGPITLPCSAYCGSHEQLPASGKLCSDARAL